MKLISFFSKEKTFSWKSVICGMKIYGSHIKSDADVGSIFLRIKRGIEFFTAPVRQVGISI